MDIHSNKSRWDTVPLEIMVGTCSFLPALDLLNFSVAYPWLSPLIMDTSALWRHVHLPYPDPLLLHFPGWRRTLSATGSTTASPILANARHAPGQESRIPRIERASRLNLFREERYRFLSEPEYYSLPDIDGGEQDDHADNTAWILLDVLDQMPLQFIRHLSFDCPPCHLCEYPCNRSCRCECHQNEHSHNHGHPLHEQSQSLHHSPPQEVVSGYLASPPPLSLPLQDLFASGLVDFSRHIHVPSLNHVFSNDTSVPNTYAPQGYHGPLAVEYHPRYNTTQHQQQLRHEQPSMPLVTPPPPPPQPSDQVDHHSPYTLNQVDLHDALLQLSLFDDSADAEPVHDDHAFSDESDLDLYRQQAETRAAFQRARLLIRILSSGQLESLETLRVPWWPATRIYTIRQQLERWSFMIEQNLEAQNQAGTSEQDSAETHIAGHSFVPWRPRWTNDLLSIPGSNSSEPTTTMHRPSHTIPSSAASSPTLIQQETRFPFPNLVRFSLRSGGEVTSHDRHCLGTTALVLSGRSSRAPSLPQTPPLRSGPYNSSLSPASLASPGSTLDSRSTSPPTSLSAPSTPPEPLEPLLDPPKPMVFRYCSLCGSQFLHTKRLLLEQGSCPGCFCPPAYAQP